MKRRAFCGLLITMVALVGAIPVFATTSNDQLPTVNIQTPTANRNWFSTYREIYSPASTRPIMAPPAIGIRSMSANADFDYLQSMASLRAQANNYYVNSFKEVFAPGGNQFMENLVRNRPKGFGTRTTSTGNYALDAVEVEPFWGLGEDELKWLLNNNIISRDPDKITMTTNSIVFSSDHEQQVRGMRPIFYRGIRDDLLPDVMMKSDFLMALHKATYGVIESRPVTFNVEPYRWAQHAYWGYHPTENHYKLFVGEELYQNVRSAATRQISPVVPAPYVLDDRSEFVTRLQGDINYVMATFPDYDQLFVTNPNVVELYLKSLIDMGFLSAINLGSNLEIGRDHEVDESGQSIEGTLFGPREGARVSRNMIHYSIIEDINTEFTSYGQITATRSQRFPVYAPELGPLDFEGKHHTFFEPDLIGNSDLSNVWGRRYIVKQTKTGGTIERLYCEDIVNEGGGTVECTHRPEAAGCLAFFENENMTVMEALRFIEAILRVREGNMSDTEAMIVSYKYGANFIGELQGADRSTVMYLTAMGILNFENFQEYAFLYEQLDISFAYVLLYRVANPAARVNFSQVQLTDSDNFWIGLGYSSYDITLNVPDASKVRSFTDDQGNLAINPYTANAVTDPNDQRTGFNLLPYTSTQRVLVATNNNDGNSPALTPTQISAWKRRLAEIARLGLDGQITNELMVEYAWIQKQLQNAGTWTVTTDEVSLINSIPVWHASGVDVLSGVGIDLYEGESFLTPAASANNRLVSFVSGGSPFQRTQALAVSEDIPESYIVEKLFDNPWLYTYRERPIMAGASPVSNADKASMGEEIDEFTRCLWCTDLNCSANYTDPDMRPDIISIQYRIDTDNYSILFFAYDQSTPMAALQWVDSNLDSVHEGAMESMKVGIVAMPMENGQRIILISENDLPLLDPDIEILGDNILVNNATGVRAIIIPERNQALIGNLVVNMPAGATMVVSGDGYRYYNLEILSALLTNTRLVEIGRGKLYSAMDVRREEVVPSYSSRGDKNGNAIIGEFVYNVTLGEGDGVNPITEAVSGSFVNMTHMVQGSNTMIQNFSEKLSNGFSLEFTVIVEWDLVLPNTSDHLNYITIANRVNPTLAEVNQFYHVRPDDSMSQLRDFWDNNIEISNALANTMYGTRNQEYITSGFLVPSVTLLFNADPSSHAGLNLPPAIVLEGDAQNKMVQANMEMVAGMWFQRVGEHLSEQWINKFIGDLVLANMILLNSDEAVDMPNHYRRYLDRLRLFDNNLAPVNSAASRPASYMLAANQRAVNGMLQNNVYYNEKAAPFAWFPVWVHMMFNNPVIPGTVSPTEYNGTLWRELVGSTRVFAHLAQTERRSYGTVFGSGNIDSVVWVLLPDGTVYRSMDPTSRVQETGRGVTVNTRRQVTDYNKFVNTQVKYQGEDYIITRYDEFYLELVRVGPVKGRYDPVAHEFVGLDTTAPLTVIGYETLRQLFVGTSDASTNERANTVDDYKPTNNEVPVSLYMISGNYLITDESGNMAIVNYSPQGTGVGMVRSDVLLENVTGVINYQPVIRLSVFSWDVRTGADGSNEIYFRNTIPAMLMNDLYIASLTRSHIDGLIAKAIGAIPLEDVPVGATVMFGDIAMTRNIHGWVTQPILNLTTAATPRIRGSSVMSEEVEVIVGSLMNMTVNVAGKIETVANFVKSAVLAPWVENPRFVYRSTLTAVSFADTLSPQLVTTSFGSQGVRGIREELINPTNPALSASYLIQFDRGLMVMPSDSSGKNFELLFASSQSGNGTIMDEPFFPINTSRFIRNRVNLDMFVTNFKPLPNQHELKQQWLADHDRAVAQDIQSFIMAVLAFTLAYLMIMCTLMFFMLKITTVEVVLRRIRYPLDGGKGVDVVQILTFGVLNIEHEIPGHRLFSTMILLCALFAILVLVQRGGLYF